MRMLLQLWDGKELMQPFMEAEMLQGQWVCILLLAKITYMSNDIFRCHWVLLFSMMKLLAASAITSYVITRRTQSGQERSVCDHHRKKHLPTKFTHKLMMMEVGTTRHQPLYTLALDRSDKFVISQFWRACKKGKAKNWTSAYKCPWIAICNRCRGSNRTWCGC